MRCRLEFFVKAGCIFFKLKHMLIASRKSFTLRATLHTHTHTHTHTHSEHKPDNTKTVISNVKFEMKTIWCEALFSLWSVVFRWAKHTLFSSIHPMVGQIWVMNKQLFMLFFQRPLQLYKCINQEKYHVNILTRKTGLPKNSQPCLCTVVKINLSNSVYGFHAATSSITGMLTPSHWKSF